MKLYNSIGPNPHVVRMFIAELGLDIETIEVDLMSGENRQEEHLKRNPSGQMPALELDNGNFLAEISVICEYLDELNGHSNLIGKTPEQRAETKMWFRRIDLQIVEPLINGFRFSEGYEFFKDRLHLIPQASDDLKAIAQERLKWLDEQLEERQKRHKANVKNGRKGGKISAELRATNQARVEGGSSVGVEHGSSIKIRKDKIRKEKIKEDNIRKDNIDPSLSTKGIKEFLKLREDDNK